MIMKKILLSGLIAICALVSCKKEASVTATPFGQLSTGEEVTLWHIENASGASMDVTDFGCRIVRICMPDRDGVVDDVVVGYGDLETMEKGDRFIGPVIGRYGNRINHASFTRILAGSQCSAMEVSKGSTSSSGRVRLSERKGVRE